MQTLDLNVKNSVRVDINTVMLLYKSGKAVFLRLLNSHELVKNSFIISIFFKLFKLVQVLHPVRIAKKLCDKCGKLRVAKCQPTSLCDTIGLVLKSLRIKLIPIFKSVLFQYLSVDSRNAVYIA